MPQKMSYLGHSYYLPDAGDIIRKPGKPPYVCLRCTSPGQPEEWVTVNLPPTLAASCANALDDLTAQGYEVEDFCLVGKLTFEPFGYDTTESLSIEKKLRVIKVMTPIFLGTQMVHVEELEIRSSERPVLHINPVTGEVVHRKKTSTMVMGTATSFLIAAKQARDAEKDFKVGHLFVWKRRSKESLLIQDFLTELESLLRPTKTRLVV